MAIEIDDEIEGGIQLFMAEHAVSREEAIKRILRDWLVGNGYLAVIDED
ncbi:hypothetical protein [Ensifer canadensis]|jgi:hypothetical protein|nr:hypothetical protein [Ensifer canadensis]UBI80543.1 hypothetical protein J3R84_37435 [Ensifer canadensis]